MTTHALASDPTPDTADHTLNRVTDLLLRLERGDPRKVSLRPLAHHRPHPTHNLVFACVHIDAGDGRPAEPFALNEVHLAAQCLAFDPPFPAAPSLAPRLADAALAAAHAVNLLNRSVS